MRALVRSPGFEPGLSGWEPDVLTKLDYDRKHVALIDLLHRTTKRYRNFAIQNSG